ncbi:MAG TPA: hypothetical protein PKE07_08070 [Lacibacter sp.]|nr:hypothetical protein [Lacibacter sp.]HMO89862.1 hypothetical protein [Lacibacter sp.]
MAENAYKQAVQDTVTVLVEARHKLFDQLFTLTVTGELKEWADAVPVGESHTFTNELFDGLEDTNVQLLMPLLREIEATAERLCNINGLPFPEEVVHIK